MAFEFTSGPKSTTRTTESISQIIERVGKGKQFMGIGRRLNTSAIGPGDYGPFVPSAETDPFASARKRPDWSVGWAWGNSVTNAWGMTLRQGWQVVFEVADEGTSRSVSARVNGSSSKSDVLRFVDMVFGEI
jgi:hypothetical protein